MTLRKLAGGVGDDVCQGPNYDHGFVVGGVHCILARGDNAVIGDHGYITGDWPESEPELATRLDDEHNWDTDIEGVLNFQVDHAAWRRLVRIRRAADDYWRDL